MKELFRQAKTTFGRRLSFHDCVGGCNGCLNVDNPDNKGLEDLVQLLDKVYKKNDYHRIISR